MSKRLQPFIAVLTLTVAILACVLPIPSVPAAPTLSSGSPTPPFSPEQVGTAVAATLTALVPTVEGNVTATAATPETTNTPANVPGGTAGPLPHSLYYLAPDSSGNTQVFRLETDGTTQHPVTSESTAVGNYDVSPADGSVAYVVSNQLVLVNADGSNRRMLVDGGAVDPNNPFMNAISNPVFSPDGQTLAFGYQGLQMYYLSEGRKDLLIENQVDDAGGGLKVPRELYAPQRYSPDGTKLLINLSYYEGGSSAIYYPATKALVRLEGGEGALICCDDTEWSSDSSSVYAASSTMGMFEPGLWKVDAATGEVTTLIPGSAGDDNYNAAKEAYLAPDGQLYYFFGTVNSPEAMFSRAPLQIVRSEADGVTGRTVLMPDTFDLLNEALWAPDASFAIVAISSAQEVFQGGRAEVVYLDGKPNVVLVPFAQQMKWGP
jgi:hypothetical protein